MCKKTSEEILDFLMKAHVSATSIILSITTIIIHLLHSTK